MKYFTDFNKTATKRVSFILATKNRATFLENTLKATKKLVKTNDELIVIDGNSTDKTLNVVEKYSKLIDIFISESDINPTHAFNKGLILAQGKYIKFLNDDDLINPEAMEQAIKVLEKNPQVDVLVCGGTILSVDKKVKRILYLPKGTNYGSSSQDPFQYGGCGIGLVFPKKILAQTGLFNMDWVSDLTFLVNCINQKINVKFCRINLFTAVAYPHSVGFREPTKARIQTLKLMKENASQKFYYQYLINSLVWRYPLLKILTFLPVLALKVTKKLQRSNKNGHKYKWDGGFS